MTNGISINAGFEFGSAQPVDSRLVLTNNEMLHADTNLFPDPYFAINADDRFLYIYSSNNTYSETTGYFKKYTTEGGKAQWYGTEEEYQALPVETQSDTSIVFYRYGSDSEKNYVVSDHSIKQEVYMSESDYQELETKDSNTVYLTPGHVRKGEESIVQNLQSKKNRNREAIKFRDIAHRGASTLAPENTLLSFQVASQVGYRYVETDVTFTKDNVPVILHDITVDRVTGTSLGNIHELDWDDIKDLYANKDPDTGKSSDYYSNIGGSLPDIDTVKIPTFEQFIAECKILGLHPYIEINYWRTDTSGWRQTKEQTKMLYDIVRRYNMHQNVTWISFYDVYLQYIIEFDPTARVGLITDSNSAENLSKAEALKTGVNEVFIDISYTKATNAFCTSCMEKDIDVEVWTVDTESAVLSLDPYVSGVTSNKLFASSIKEEALLGYPTFCKDVTNRYKTLRPTLNSWLEYPTGTGTGFHFTHLDNCLVRLTIELNILKNDSTPSAGTVHISEEELPDEWVPVRYQSFPIEGYWNDNGQEKTAIVRFGIGMRYDSSTSNSKKLLISEITEIPTGGLKLRGTIYYNINI